MIEYAIARRTPRYNFVVDVLVTDVRLGIHIKATTNTLGLFGCGVDASKPFAKGTAVSIKLSHRGAEVSVLARVIYATPELGMGMVFTDVSRENEQILEWWIEELMSTQFQKR